jgi:hypothetical protein
MLVRIMICRKVLDIKSIFKNIIEKGRTYYTDRRNKTKTSHIQI